MKTLTRRAYAKINLTLDVGVRRPNGYHDIRSIMQTVALCDTLTVTHTPAVPGVRLEVIGPEASGVPEDASNLVCRAAVRLQKIAAARGKLLSGQSGLHITLNKRVPSQAGLGGGSSDAAAALRAVDQLFGLALSGQRLIEIGASLGADVPFFLLGGTALAEGLGEQVTPLVSPAPAWLIVIVKPPVGVSTAAAYAALDALPDRRRGTATAAWLRGEPRLGNDFQSVILTAYPAVAEAYTVLSLTGETEESFRPLLCGSGSALFCRLPTSEAADRLAQQLTEAGIGKVWVTATVGAIG